MTTAPPSGGSIRSEVLADLAVGFVCSIVIAAATWSLLGLPATYPIASMVLYLAMAALIAVTLPPDLSGPGVGPANRVTLARVVLLAPLTALVAFPGALGTPGRWAVIATGTAIMVLDGFDGWVARRTGAASAYGARFDMETDAFLMLALSMLVWSEDRAGAWVLLIGAMRYVFVGAGFAWHALRAELFPSMRRKVVCVVQGVALLVCLGPIIPPAVAVSVAAIALLALLGSFGVDTVWLLRHGGEVGRDSVQV